MKTKKSDEKRSEKAALRPADLEKANGGATQIGFDRDGNGYYKKAPIGRRR